MKLQAVEVTKDYPRIGKGTNHFAAVSKATLTLEPGTVSVIMGRSGSGKSTLLNMLSGLLLPSSGEVLADDASLYAMKDAELSRFRNEHFGIIPQGQTAISSLTVLENVLLPQRFYRKEADAAGAEALLEQLGIQALKNELPKSLSGGELRRMAIARALGMKPEVILADEPTGDLDDENTELVLQALRHAADQGAAVLLVTHESDSLRIADRSYRMNAGELSVTSVTEL